MKVYGDIPEEHRILLEELVLLENYVNGHMKDMPALSVGKGLVCMAHDYYSIEMEEEGERLLLATHKHCPGYFMGPILVHVEIDDQFDYLVKRLRKNPLSLEVMRSLGFEK